MGNTALITGSSKRIGKAIAEHLAEQGWNIIIHYNTSDKEADQLRALLQKRHSGQMFDVVEADFSKTKQAEALIPKVVGKHGPFQLLINNASVFDKGYLKETSDELFDSQMFINFRAPFILIRDFVNECKEGMIINMVDTKMTANKSDYGAYTLSKKALWELTKMAAFEFAPQIRVNAIAPGMTLAPEGHDEEYLVRLAKRIPMRKPGGVGPVIRSVDYILNNPDLTGQILFADGGEHLGKIDK